MKSSTLRVPKPVIATPLASSPVLLQVNIVPTVLFGAPIVVKLVVPAVKITYLAPTVYGGVVTIEVPILFIIYSVPGV